MSNPEGSASPPEHDPEFHNPILTRTREPARETHPMLYMIPVVLVIIVLIGYMVWQHGHPPTPIENHSVAAAPTTP